MDTTRGVVGPDPRRWLALASILLAAAMDLIDVTIVNVAVPSIRRDLGASSSEIEWTVAGYALAFGLLLVTGGRLGDAFGRRRLFLVGVAGFTAASALCGLAPSAEVLIVARIVQGGLAALMVPQILSVIQVSFPPEERPKAYALYGASVAIATVSGPLLGGLLVGADLFGLGWRPIFLINLPVGVATLVVAAALLPESRAEHAQRFDLAGVGLLSVALMLLLYPLVAGPQAGWPAWTFVSMAASVPVFALFAWYQRSEERRGGSPLVPPRLFRERGFTGGVLVQLVVFSGVTSFFFVLAITLQAGLGFSALHAGLTFLPFSVGIAVASGAAVQFAPRFGRRLPATGALVMAFGMGAVLFATGRGGADLSSWTLVPGLVMGGLGIGLVAPTIVTIALANVRPNDAGSASGVVNTAGQLGGAIGVAVIGVIFFGALPEGPRLAADPGGGFMSAFRAALWFEVGIYVLSALLMVLLLPKPTPAQGKARP